MQSVWEYETEHTVLPMRGFAHVRKQIPLLGIPAIIGGLLLASIYLLSNSSPHDIAFFTRDPAAIMNAPWYIGQLSNLGIMAWAAATALWLFGAQVSRALQQPRERWFLLCSGLLTGLMLFDDAFMLHEDILPNLFGVSEKVVYLGYLAAAGVYLAAFVQQIWRSDYLLAVMSGGWLGLSVAFDALLPMSPMAVFAEDGAKFVGIIFWVAYAARVVARMVWNSTTPAP